MVCTNTTVGRYEMNGRFVLFFHPKGSLKDNKFIFIMLLFSPHDL